MLISSWSSAPCYPCLQRETPTVASSLQHLERMSAGHCSPVDGSWETLAVRWLYVSVYLDSDLRFTAVASPKWESYISVTKRSLS